MKIADLLLEDDIIPELRAKDGPEAILELGLFLAKRHPEISAERAVAALAAREGLGSTAVGDGLAIPHAKVESLSQVVACLGRSSRGIRSGSPDGRPTHLFFVLLAPASDPGEHLKALARISRLFRGTNLGTRLLAAKSRAAMYEVLAGEEE